MENSVWRSRAKIVAIVDLVFSGLGLAAWTIVFGTSLFAAAFATDDALRSIDAKSTKETRDSTRLMLIASVIASAILIITTAINFWAAVKLLKSTDTFVDPGEASQMAKVWRIVAIIFLVTGTIAQIFSATFYTIIVSLFINLLFIYVVQRYIQELEIVVQSRPRLPTGKI